MDGERSHVRSFNKGSPGNDEQLKLMIAVDSFPRRWAILGKGHVEKILGCILRRTGRMNRSV